MQVLLLSVLAWTPLVAGLPPAIADEWHQRVLDEMLQIPGPPDFGSYLPVISDMLPLARPLRIASPCIGINGCGVACQAMKIAARYTNIWDLEDGYMKWLTYFMAEHGSSQPCVREDSQVVVVPDSFWWAAGVHPGERVWFGASPRRPSVGPRDVSATPSRPGPGVIMARRLPRGAGSK